VTASVCYAVGVAAYLNRRFVATCLLVPAFVGACGSAGDETAPDAARATESDARVADGPVSPDADAASPPDAARPEPADGAPSDAAPTPMDDAARPTDGAVEGDADPVDAASPSGAPACANGLDDDADGRADFPADPQCGTAEGGAEASVCDAAVSFVALGPSGGRFEVDLGSGAGQFEQSACGPGFGRERVFALDLERPARLHARLEALGGGVQLSLRTDCDDETSESICDAPDFGAAMVDAEVASPGRVFLVAESNAFEPAFDATLEVVLEPPRGERPPPFAGCPVAPGALTVPAEGGRLPFDSLAAVDAFPTCAPTEGGLVEQVFALTLDAPTRVRLEVQDSPRDTVLGLYAGCDPSAAPVACDDDSGPGTAARLERPALPAGTYFVVVEARDVEGGLLSATLDVSLSPAPAPACDNAADDDADGRVDASDPGCNGRGDPDETDPEPAPSCGNGLDDDGDGRTDWPDDAACTGPARWSEGSACGPELSVRPLEVVEQVEDRSASSAAVVDGPATDDRLDLPCADRPGLEHWFVLPVQRRSRVELWVEDADGRAPLAIAAFSACSDGFIDCRSRFAAGPLVLADIPAGPLYVAVEAPSDPTASSAPWVVRAAIDSLVRACNDAIDNDADGRIDRADPGCALELDDDEGDEPEPLPECGNGLDDDQDGVADYPEDPQCRFAGTVTEAPSCEADVPVTRLRGPGETRLSLRTAGRSFYEASCGGGARGPEQVVVLTLDEPSDVTLVVENNDYDTVLFVRRVCDDAATELGCNDDTNGLASALSLPALEPGDYFVVLDGYDRSAGGADLVIQVNAAQAPAPEEAP